MSNKEGFGHAMRHTWSLQVLMFLNNHWTVYVSFCKSLFFVVSLLEASPVHETLWDTKRGSPKVWKSDISCLMAILQMTREHFIFNAWKMTGPWVVSLQELFLIGTMTFWRKHRKVPKNAKNSFILKKRITRLYVSRNPL